MRRRRFHGRRRDDASDQTLGLGDADRTFQRVNNGLKVTGWELQTLLGRGADEVASQVANAGRYRQAGARARQYVLALRAEEVYKVRR